MRIWPGRAVSWGGTDEENEKKNKVLRDFGLWHAAAWLAVLLLRPISSAVAPRLIPILCRKIFLSESAISQVKYAVLLNAPKIS